MMSRIIYTGAFRFPEGDAAAARVLGVAKALRSSGYEVEFAGWEEQERSSDRQIDGCYRYQDFLYTSQGDLRHQSLPPIKRLLRYLRSGGQTLQWLASRDLSNVSTIIVYHGGSIFLSRLAILCRKRGINLLTDCTEWYDPSALVGGRFGIPYLDNEFRMRILNRVVGQGIVISTYLQKFYENAYSALIRIPPLVDLSEPKWQGCQGPGSDDGILRLVYAGTPGKKDLLGTALRGFFHLKAEGYPVELDLIGPSLDDVVKCLGGGGLPANFSADALVIHGRVPQSVVPGLLARADFSILMRPQKRYANAGFSTKLVESLAAGVPVIANVTSDINVYIKDGESGLLMRDDTMEAFVRGVRRALSLDPSARAEMRSAARRVAEKYFDYRICVDDMRTFMEKVARGT